MEAKDNSLKEYPLNNFLRSLTMLEKALDRLARQNYLDPGQKPEIFLEIESAIYGVREWVQEYRMFSFLFNFCALLIISITELTALVRKLMSICRPVKGKRAEKKSRRIKEQAALCGSIEKIIGNLPAHQKKIECYDSIISIRFEQALLKAFEDHCLKKCEKIMKDMLSGRGEKTNVFPWSDHKTYPELVADKKRFKKEVVARPGELIHATGHRSGCKGHKGYKLKGFRPKPRKIVMPGGEKHEFLIRMVECRECGQRFSLLPSFIPREKHFSIDIIGRTLRGIVLFGQSFSAAFNNIKSCGRRLKSRQTLYNWLRWAGTFHPAELLTRAGAKCSGYFQEDEGFEKEPNLRTYTVVMVDPESQAVWHMDYIDHVDEKNLCSSFEKFLEHVDFNVKGVTKDRWEPSTKALKSVLHRVWIEFCHLHCLKKFNKAIIAYQKEIKCDDKEVNRLYGKFKKVLNSATNAGSLKAKLKSLNDKAFEHPLLKARVKELRENAVRYTSHNKRSGITKTTSMVDNFLKIIKRKLRQAGSFRDKEWAKILFKATANIRNFVPFLSGAKNAGKSPFMLAQGETYNLPWMQVMNVHNCFLFTHNAF